MLHLIYIITVHSQTSHGRSPWMQCTALCIGQTEG